MLHRNIILAALIANAAAAEAGTWSTRMAAGMSVRIYTPSSAGSYAAGRGLMIGLHGCTQQNTALETRGNWEPAADRFGVVIALPQVINGGVIAGCWDYYGANHTRSTRHEGPVLDLVEALASDAALGIDRAQIYVSGLSSGGGEAMVLGCIAPDVFAGVGINAGPAVGTASSDIGRVATTAAAAEALCRRLGGAHAASFATQLTSIIYGTSDFIVAPGYGPLEADVFGAIYEAPTAAPIDVSALPGFMPAGEGETRSDRDGPRVQRIAVQGMGHAFPAGSGAGNTEASFVASKGPAWPMVMLDLFTTHSRRAQGAALLPDGGTTGPRGDAGTVVPGRDGGVARRRDASASPDGAIADDAAVAADAGNKTDELSGGCTAARGSLAWPMLGALLLMVLRRRAC